VIGIFDSGIGGLTVVRAVRALFPAADIIYFGDTARTPYGTKSPETVRRFAVENTELLLERGARLVIIACNTASSVAAETLAERFPVPVLDVISPAVEMAAALPKLRAIGVIGTRGTIGSGVYEEKLKAASPKTRVYSQPCPLLVPLVEEGWLNQPETRRIVKKYLQPLKMKGIDALILGCTHYPVLKDLIADKAGKRVRVIDSSVAAARNLAAQAAERPEIGPLLEGKGSLEILVSDVTGQFARLAQMILKERVELTHVQV
jgi:glutamate racemase